ncbi:MAG TPA: HD domain-containing phosphohydrolase [Bacteroidota bacterium]|nr:HD domain-containing phosphohydrolase [Bacteroidota bacterium]
MEAERSNERGKILLVEDDELQRLFMKRILTQEPSFEVVTAEDGRAALDLALGDPPEVVVSDYYLPGLNGIELCKEFRKNAVLRESVFILITASNAVEDRVRGLDSGADDFVTKPAHPDEMLARIRACLRMKRMRDELREDKKELAALNDLLQQGFAGVLQLLARLIGMKIPNATDRAERAEKIVRWIGERLELEPLQLGEVCVAAKIHEIGKIGLPDALVGKNPEELTEEERTVIGGFPTFGERIVDGIAQLKGVGRILRHQLENYDGTGYPEKLMQQQIPLGSRILRLVNLVEECAVRQRKDRDGILETLHHARGTTLDPIVLQLADEYIRVVENPSWLEGKHQVSIQDLRPGMILAHDLTTGSGTKLLPKGLVMTPGQIEKVLTHHHFDPVINGVYVCDTLENETRGRSPA